MFSSPAHDSTEIYIVRGESELLRDAKQQTIENLCVQNGWHFAFTQAYLHGSMKKLNKNDYNRYITLSKHNSMTTDVYV